MSKSDWSSLNDIEKEPYIEKAKYLLERGYLGMQEKESLAKKIYEKKENC